MIRAVRQAHLSDSLCRKSVTLLLSTGGTKNFGLLFLRDLAVRVEFRNGWHADSLTLVEFRSPDAQNHSGQSLKVAQRLLARAMIRLSLSTKVTK